MFAELTGAVDAPVMIIGFVNSSKIPNTKTSNPAT